MCVSAGVRVGRGAWWFTCVSAKPTILLNDIVALSRTGFTCCRRANCFLRVKQELKLKNSTFAFGQIKGTVQVRQTCTMWAAAAWQKSVKTKLFLPPRFSQTRLLLRTSGPIGRHGRLSPKQHGEGGDAGPIVLLWQNREQGHGDAAGEIWTRRELSAARQRHGAGGLLSVCEVSCRDQLCSARLHR